MASSFKLSHYTPLQRGILVLLLVLTFGALLPWQPQQVVDARSLQPFDGVTLSMPWWAGLIEPVAAIGQIVMGSPDFRITLLSSAAWIIAGLFLVTLLLRRHRGQSLLRASAWGIASGVVGVWAFIAYMLLMLHIYLPGWSIESDNRDWLFADLQSHTFGSHDGLVSAQTNIDWHRTNGYDIAAVTEHDDPAGSFHVRAVAAGQELGVIPGIEVNNEYGSFLLGVGLQPSRPLLTWSGGGKERFSNRFVESVESHDGAVIAMAWKLNAGHVEKLAEDGIHAIELVNNGHPDVPHEVREAMLRISDSHNVVLVSSTDWHGWGGQTRAWTLFKMAGAAGMSPQQRSERAVQMLKERQVENIVPLVSGSFGPPPAWRAGLSPWVETVRYAAELSASRLAGWWLWGIALVLIIGQLQKRDIATGHLLAGGVFVGMAVLLINEGVTISGRTTVDGVLLSDVLEDIGVMAISAGVPLLPIGLWWLWRSLPRRQAA